MYSMMAAFIKKTMYISWSRSLSKPLNLSIITILIAISYYYLASLIIGDPTDLKNMRHGYIKVMPKHLSSLDKSEPNTKIKDTLRCAIPPIVHYVWCGTDNFQFQNYLSVLSAYKLLKPTEILFHYVHEPEMDEFGYYQFHGDLLRDLPNFFMEPLQDDRMCSDDTAVASQAVGEMLSEYGGIFIGSDVILSYESLNYLDKPVTIFEPDSKGFSSGGLLFLSPGTHASYKERSVSSRLSSSVIDCQSFTQFQENDPCVIFETELFPFKIFTLESPFGKLARSLAYGKTEILQPSLKKELIPNIVHYIWLGDREFRFDNFLSLLSTLYIQKAETVFVHGDSEPSGKYWAAAVKTGKVKFIRRDSPKTVFGNEIKAPFHASDALRFDILRRYGGISVEWNFLWTKELSEYQRKHEAIACLDWSQGGHFPASFNFGIIGGLPGASHFSFLSETFRHYLGSDLGFNTKNMAYKVYEQHPDTLLVDNHLQVICSESFKCHSVWLKDDVKNHGKLEGSELDWKTDTNGVLFTDSDLQRFQDKETLLSSTGMLAQIGQNIIQLSKQGRLLIY